MEILPGNEKWRTLITEVICHTVPAVPEDAILNYHTQRQIVVDLISLDILGRSTH